MGCRAAKARLSLAAFLAATVSAWRWDVPSPSGLDPGMRYGHSLLGWQSTTTQGIVCGGFDPLNGSLTSGCLLLDPGSNWRFKALVPPSQAAPRAGHLAAYWGDYLLLYGGNTSSVADPAAPEVFKVGVWSPAPGVTFGGPIPPARMGHAGVMVTIPQLVAPHGTGSGGGAASQLYGAGNKAPGSAQLAAIAAAAADSGVGWVIFGGQTVMPNATSGVPAGEILGDLAVLALGDGISPAFSWLPVQAEGKQRTGSGTSSHSPDEGGEVAGPTPGPRTFHSLAMNPPSTALAAPNVGRSSRGASRRLRAASAASTAGDKGASFSSGAIHTVATGELILYGGISGGGLVLDEVWVLNVGFKDLPSAAVMSASTSAHAPGSSSMGSADGSMPVASAATRVVSATWIRRPTTNAVPLWGHKATVVSSEWYVVTGGSSSLPVQQQLGAYVDSRGVRRVLGPNPFSRGFGLRNNDDNGGVGVAPVSVLRALNLKDWSWTVPSVIGNPPSSSSPLLLPALWIVGTTDKRDGSDDGVPGYQQQVLMHGGMRVTVSSHGDAAKQRKAMLNANEQLLGSSSLDSGSSRGDNLFSRPSGRSIPSAVKRILRRSLVATRSSSAFLPAASGSAAAAAPYPPSILYALTEVGIDELSPEAELALLIGGGLAAAGCLLGFAWCAWKYRRRSIASLAARGYTTGLQRYSALGRDGYTPLQKSVLPASVIDNAIGATGASGAGPALFADGPSASVIAANAAFAATAASSSSLPLTSKRSASANGGGGVGERTSSGRDSSHSSSSHSVDGEGRKSSGKSKGHHSSKGKSGSSSSGKKDHGSSKRRSAGGGGGSAALSSSLPAPAVEQLLSDGGTSQQ